MVNAADGRPPSHVGRTDGAYASPAASESAPETSRATDPNDLRAASPGQVSLDRLEAQPPPTNKLSSHSLQEASAVPRNTAFENNAPVNTPTSKHVFKQIDGAATNSGNKTATYSDNHGNQWIGKKSSLTKAVTEVTAQRLATELLGTNGAPETLLTEDGTLFSKKPAGESSNLEQFFADPSNRTQLSEAAQSKIQDTFLDAVVFKIITGDCDIIPENFVLDHANHTVLPIDGENAFIGLVAGRGGYYENWSQQDFDKFIDSPGDFIDNIFSEAGIKDVGFLSKNINQEQLLARFASQTEQLYDQNYLVVQKVVDQTIADLTLLDENTGRLSQDNTLLHELHRKLDNIKLNISTSVEQLYAFTERKYYSEYADNV